ncbi:MAG: response regulator transcription factor [Ignavibacteriales bacterium]|nr:response regulator transcription factor [Ignavibacteriales bacterium]
MKHKILIADDSELFREMLAERLCAEPDMHVVGEVEDGVAALEQTKMLQPEIVLLDMRMPKLNGIETARRLQTEHPGVKVIFLSSFSNREYVQAAKECGAANYVQKIFLDKDLLPAIRSAARKTANV